MNICTILPLLGVTLCGSLYAGEAKGTTMKIYQTTRGGDRLAQIGTTPAEDPTKVDLQLSLNPDRRYQEFLGVGGSFTESAADRKSVV